MIHLLVFTLYSTCAHTRFLVLFYPKEKSSGLASNNLNCKNMTFVHIGSAQLEFMFEVVLH